MLPSSATRTESAPRRRDRGLVAGSVAQRPGRGGHTWVFLQYLLGLRELGWDVAAARPPGARHVRRRGRQPLPARAVRQRPLHAGGDGAASASSDSYAVLLEGGSGSHSGIRAAGELWSGVAIRLAVPERQRLRRRPRGPRAGAAARIPRHRPGLRADVARARACTTPVRGPRRLRDGGREHRRSRMHDSHRRHRLDHDAAAGRAVAVAVTRGRAASASRASGAGAGRSGRSSTTGRPTACACTSSAASPTCRARSGQPFELALDIDEADAADVELLRGGRLGAGRPGVVARRSLGLPRLRPGLQGRAHDRQEHVRRVPQRLVQRSQHLLPGQRQAGAGPGHRLLAALPRRARAWCRSATSTRRSRRSSDRA